MIENTEEDPLIRKGSNARSLSRSGSDMVSGQQAQEFIVYHRRWFILTVISLLNATNAMTWIKFAPIATDTAEFYSVSLSDVNWLSLIYLVIFIPFGLVSAWIIDIIGLRFSILLSAWLNGTGAALHVVSALYIVHDEPSYPILLLGQGLAALAQPIAMAVPVKVAALWFGSDQRALATTIGSLCNPLGIMIANLLSPQILDQRNSHMIWVMVTFAVLPVFTACMATVTICQSKPPTPPSRSADDAITEPFFLGLKQLIKLPRFMVLAVCFGIGLGSATALSSLIQQLLCPLGYSDKFSGICGALFIIFGLLLAPLIGLIVDKWKVFEEAAKICWAFAACSYILFMELCRFSDLHVGVGAAISLAGMFTFPLFPLSLELAIESSYPVAEATSATFILLTGQLFGILFIILMQVGTVPFPSYYEYSYIHCNQEDSNTPNSDFTYSNIGLIGIICIASMVFITFYRSDYRRLKAEQRLAARKILNLSNSSLHSVPVDPLTA